MINVLFATGVGYESYPELIQPALRVFEKYKEHMRNSADEEGFSTSLTEYNSRMPSVITYIQDPDIVAIKTAIVSGAQAYFGGLGFDVDKYDFEVCNLWMNEMLSHSVHKVHAHYGYDISGCFYVEVPADSGLVLLHSKGESGFSRPFRTDGSTMFNAIRQVLKPTAGDMLFWPSDLKHEVPASSFTGIRRTMAFDLRLYAK